MSWRAIVGGPRSNLWPWMSSTSAVIIMPIQDVIAHKDIGAGKSLNAVAYSKTSWTILSKQTRKKEKENKDRENSFINFGHKRVPARPRWSINEDSSHEIRQPAILAVSKWLWSSATGWGAANSLRCSILLCIMLIVMAPMTHINVPTILILVYMQFRSTLSNLHERSN